MLNGSQRHEPFRHPLSIRLMAIWINHKLLKCNRPAVAGYLLVESQWYIHSHDLAA